MIEQKLKNEFKDDLVHLKVEEVSNDGFGIKAIIVANSFNDMSLINRQRKINDILKNEIEKIHSFEL